MKRLLVFVFAVVLLGSCSSKKIFSVRKIEHNSVTNNIASQYDYSQKKYSTHNNLKNSSGKNQREFQASLPTVKNKQDFLASKDKVELSVLTNNYSYKKLPHFIKQEKINNSFLEKVPILKNKEITKKKSKIKDKKNKALKIIGTSLLIVFTLIIYGITHLILFFNSGYGAIIGINIFLVLLSAFFTYLSYKSVKKTIKAFSMENNKDDIKDSID